MTYPEIYSEDSFAKKEKCYAKKQKEENRNKMKNLKHKEYQKLRIMVPSIASKPNVSKVTVIEEAVRYIDHLHTALLTKLEEQGSSFSNHSDSIRTKCTNGESLPKSGPTALERVKKADYSLYLKLREQMQAFAANKFCLMEALRYEDGFDVDCMTKESLDHNMK